MFLGHAWESTDDKKRERKKPEKNIPADEGREHRGRGVTARQPKEDQRTATLFLPADFAQ